MLLYVVFPYLVLVIHHFVIFNKIKMLFEIYYDLYVIFNLFAFISEILLNIYFSMIDYYCLLVIKV